MFTGKFFLMKLNIIQQRKLWWGVSLSLIVGSLIAMIVSTNNPGIKYPLRRGLDFTGGTKLQYELDCKTVQCKPIDLGVLRGIAEARGLGGGSVQTIDPTEASPAPGFLIRTNKALSLPERQQLETELEQKIGKLNADKKDVNLIGPVLGKQLFTNGLLAMALSFLGILIYLAFRFKLDYALFAFIALFHDVFITMGVFSVLGMTIGTEIDSLFVVGILTIIGFSVNDTVVIYDRVREVNELAEGGDFNQIVDDAVNQTLTRSINTTLTVLLTLFAIFFFGGATLKDFALTLIVGFTAGAYSSIFIASTLLAWWRTRSTEKSTEKLNLEGS
jgi:preprotein translocase subunit SecF